MWRIGLKHIQPVLVNVNQEYVAGRTAGRYPHGVEKSEAHLAKRLGARVRERRAALGLSQAMLAEHIETSVVYVSLLERGQRLPSVPTLLALARALSTSTDALVSPVSRVEHEADPLDIAARQVPTSLRPLVARMLTAINDPAASGVDVGRKRG